MVKVWKTEEVTSHTGSIIESAVGSVAESEGVGTSVYDMPFRDIVRQPAGRFVKSMQRWCPCKIAESYGKGRNMIKISEKNSYRLVRDAVESNNKNPFSVKDVIGWIDGVDKTDGILQHRMLNAMVCLGKLKKSTEEINIGDKRIKHSFVKQDNCVKCPHLSEKGKCILDWPSAATTDYFSRESD